MLAHVLVDALGVELAAEQVISMMKSLAIDVSDVRRACAIRRVEDLAQNRNMVPLYAEAEKFGKAIVFELLEGEESLCIPARQVRLLDSDPKPLSS